MNLLHMAQASDKFQEQMDSMARRMVRGGREVVAWSVAQLLPTMDANVGTV